MASAEDYAGWIVQNQDRKGTPEFETVSQAYQLARGQPKAQSVAQPTLPERIAGSAPVRFAIGAAEPVLGAAQLAANALPGDAGKAVNDHLAQLEGMIQAGRRGTSQDDPGFDLARFGGNVLSPANAALAKALPAATTTLGRAATGAAAGAVGGATMPVTDAGDDYAQKKAAQVGLGTLAGGIFGPAIGKVADVVGPKVAALATRLSPSAQATAGARASLEADEKIAKALADVGASIADVPKAQMQAMRQQVMDGLKAGKQIDPAALIRQADFEQLAIPATRGQLTRDATQFAQERNLRGVAGVGEPLQIRFDQQNQRLQRLIAELRGNPSEPYQAGQKIQGALGSIDERMKAGVDDLYAGARDHVGRAAPMDAAGFSKAANLALDDQMLGHYLPPQVRGILNDVSAGKIPFNVNTAVQIDSTLSAAQRSAGARTPEALAIGKVRDALNAAGIENSVGADAKAAFDAARGAARQRFSLHDAIPALKAAADGEAPDAFVQKFVIGGKVEETRKLADLLKKTDPAAFEEARAQIGARITRAAFGENMAGDKLAAPERLAAELRKIGVDKLKAFYSDAEIEQLKRVARVAAYINSHPSSAPVNTSNNIGAVLGILGRIPGVPAAAAIGNAIQKTATTARDVNAALAARVPEKAAELSPAAQRRLAIALQMGAGGAGMASAAGIQ